MTKNIFLGYDTNGESVYIPVFHSLITGLTQTGKTETIRNLALRAAKEGYTVLLMDVKKKTLGESDFADIADAKIPIYLKETTDPLILKGLLESDAHFRLNFQFTELIIACQTATSLLEVKTNIEKVLVQKVHPVRKDKLETLRFLLDRLLEELNMVRYSITSTLMLPQTAGVFVMDVTMHSDSFKQLVVKGVCEEIRNDYTKVILVLDESHIHVPQQYSSASKFAVTKLLKEGASSEQFVWLADQTISEIDKDPIKQCEVWMIGRQREFNEAEHAFKQLPYKGNLKLEDIMRLPLGFFLVSTHEWAKLTYVKPEWVPVDVALQIARKEIPPSESAKFKAVPIALYDDPFWKEKFDELEKKYNTLVSQVSTPEQEQKRAAELAELRTKLQGANDELDKMMKLWQSLKEQVNDLIKENTFLTDRLKAYQAFDKAVQDIASEIVEQKMKDFSGSGSTAGPLTGYYPAGITVTEQKPNIELKVAEPTLSLDEGTVEGKVLVMALNKKLPEKFTFKHVKQALQQEYSYGPRDTTITEGLSNLVGKWKALTRWQFSNQWVYALIANAKDRIKTTISDQPVKEQEEQ